MLREGNIFIGFKCKSKLMIIYIDTLKIFLKKVLKTGIRKSLEFVWAGREFIDTVGEKKVTVWLLKIFKVQIYII